MMLLRSRPLATQRCQCPQRDHAVPVHLLSSLSIARERRRAGLTSEGPAIDGGSRGRARQLIHLRSGFFFGGPSSAAAGTEEENVTFDHASPATSPSDAQESADQQSADAAEAVDGADGDDDEARALALEVTIDGEDTQRDHPQTTTASEAEKDEEENADEVLAVVLAAARAAGRSPGPAEVALAQRLKDNWYSTARDVAALSAQELAALGAPLRVRAAAAAAVAEAEAAAEALSGAAEGGGDSEKSDQQQPASASSAALLELDPDIMKRRAPPRRRPFKRGSVRVTRKAPGASWVGAAAEEGGSGASSSPSSCSSPQPFSPSPSRHSYGLLESEMHPDLRLEFERLERFCTERTLGRRRPPVSRATHEGTVRYLRLLLGWLARVKKAVPSPQGVTTLRQAFPSREREGAALLFEFRDFLERERGANARTVFNAMMSAAHAVRFLWGEGGEAPGDNGGGGKGGKGDSGGEDPPVLLEVRAMAGAAFKQTRRCPLVADESKKWLTWAEYGQLVAALRLECAGLTPAGNARSQREVAACLQRYLIFAFLSCIPDRQRTLRELRVGHTLVKEPLVVVAGAAGGGGVGAGAGTGGAASGDSANDSAATDSTAANANPPYRWIVRHGAGDYKTGRLYGPRPPLVVAPFLYPELEAYIQEWRRHLQPGHDFLFTTVSSKGEGRPLTASSLYKLFSHTALVMTGRPMNPHLMRDLVVTHLRAQGTNEPEMEALAIYMGHSVAQQRSSYDRRTRAQKAQPAVELMGRLAAQGGGALGGLGGGGGGSGEGEALKGMFSDGLKL